ncbi:pyroglutamyl-peptidase 1 [Euwallacea similis]|uniref:pyroglutamyl-peptidase 1 n=1 Tax=Euwallacea similis TaxID=1736056 RepID=UPI00344D3BF5
MSETTNNNILVTGFGSFGVHKINASWEAVSALPDKIESFNIIKNQIPVEYKYVEKNVPLLWEQYNPKLVIHVGVSSLSTEIQLETCANRTGYIKQDVSEACPQSGQACCGKRNSEDCIKTGLSTEVICNRLNQNPLLKASLSCNSGRYLCEFIYYVSLNVNSKRTLFVHVPPLDQPFSKSQLTFALEEIIRCALELIEEEEQKYSIEFQTSAAKVYKNGRAAVF